MSWVFFFAVDLLLLSFFLMGFLLSSRFFLLLFLGFYFIYLFFYFSGFFLLFLGSLFEIKCKKLKIHVFLNLTIKNSRPMWHICIQLSK